MEVVVASDNEEEVGERKREGRVCHMDEAGFNLSLFVDLGSAILRPSHSVGAMTNYQKDQEVNFALLNENCHRLNGLLDCVH